MLRRPANHSRHLCMLSYLDADHSLSERERTCLSPGCSELSCTTSASNRVTSQRRQDQRICRWCRSRFVSCRDPTSTSFPRSTRTLARSEYQCSSWELTSSYDERVLPSIGNEVLKAIVAQFDASELITNREIVSARIRDDLLNRAKDFGIELEDVSIVSFRKPISEWKLTNRPT